MSDRIDQVRTRTITTAPLPMPGRLVVDFYDDLFDATVSLPLEEVPSRTQVSAAGVLTRVRRLDPRLPRIMAVLTDPETRDSAAVSFPPHVASQIPPALLREGARVVVRGLVQYRNDGLPVGIDALAVRAAELGEVV